MRYSTTSRGIVWALGLAALLLALLLPGGRAFAQSAAWEPERAGPPTAEAVVYGVLQLQKKIRRTGTIVR